MHITTTSAGTHTTAKRWLSVALWMACLHCTNSMAQEAASLPLAAESPTSGPMVTPPADELAQPAQQASAELQQQHKRSRHASAVPYIHEGMNYYYARRILFGNGWRPLKTALDPIVDKNLPSEVDSCNSANVCHAYFHKDHDMLSIKTDGDYFPGFGEKSISKKDRAEYPIITWLKISPRFPLLRKGMAYADAREEALNMGWKPGLGETWTKKDYENHYQKICVDDAHPPAACSDSDRVIELRECDNYIKPMAACSIWFTNGTEWYNISIRGNLEDLNAHGDKSRLLVQNWFLSLTH